MVGFFLGLERDFGAAERFSEDVPVTFWVDTARFWWYCSSTGRCSICQRFSDGAAIDIKPKTYSVRKTGVA